MLQPDQSCNCDVRDCWHLLCSSIWAICWSEPSGIKRIMPLPSGKPLSGRGTKFKQLNTQVEWYIPPKSGHLSRSQAHRRCRLSSEKSRCFNGSSSKPARYHLQPVPNRYGRMGPSSAYVGKGTHYPTLRAHSELHVLLGRHNSNLEVHGGNLVLRIKKATFGASDAFLRDWDRAFAARAARLGEEAQTFLAFALSEVSR